MRGRRVVVIHQRGLSLIELMIVVALIGLVIAVAAPYTSAWSHQSDIDQFDAKLHLGASQARADALRNPLGAIASEVVAVLRVEDGKITVSRCQLPSSCSTGTELWSSVVSTAVAIHSDDGSAVQTLRFNTLGNVVNFDYPLTYTLTKGSYTDDHPGRALY